METKPPQGARIVVISNQKGGCGKTALALNLGTALAHRGSRVLVVDLDAQQNATIGLGISPDDVDVSMAEALVTPEAAPMHEVVLETEVERLHLAPASIELASFQSKMAREIGRETRLRKALAPLVPHYDYILVDTPPSLGLLTVNAFVAAHEILVPLQLHPFAFDGLDALLETANLVREELNPGITLSGIVVMMYNGRIKLQREILQLIEARPDVAPHLYRTFVRSTIDVPEANDARMPVAEYFPESTATRDFDALASEFLERHPARKAESTKDISSIKNRILELNRMSRAKIETSPSD